MVEYILVLQLKMLLHSYFGGVITLMFDRRVFKLQTTRSSRIFASVALGPSEKVEKVFDLGIEVDKLRSHNCILLKRDDCFDWDTMA